MPEDLNALESVWRNAALRALVAGRLFASVAEWMWYTVATVYAFTLAGVGAVGAIGVAAVFPAAFLSPALGYVIDRFPRERVLAAMLALRFVSLIAAVVSAAFFPSVGVLIAVAVAEGVASLFVRPTTAALLPSVTRRPEDLVRAHAALGFTDNIGVLVGPVCGGLILAGTTPAIAFATSAVLALVSFVTAIRVRVDVTDLVELTPSAGLRHALTEATRGARDVAGRDVRSIALVTALAFAVSGAGEVFVVPLAIDELRWGEAGTGLLMACIAGGGLVAGVVLGMIGQRRLGPWFVGAGVAMAIALALIGAAPIAVVVIPACIAFGAGGVLVETASQVQVQSLVPSSAGGRVLGTLEGLGYFAIAAGVWATTKMIERLVAAHQPARPGRGQPWSARSDWRGHCSAQTPGSRRHANASAPSMGSRCSRRCRTPCANGSRPSSKSWTSRPPTSWFTRASTATPSTSSTPAHSRCSSMAARFGHSGPTTSSANSRCSPTPPRTATVRAATDCRLWVLPRRAFLSVLTGFAATSHVITAASAERQAAMPARPQRSRRPPRAGPAVRLPGPRHRARPRGVGDDRTVRRRHRRVPRERLRRRRLRHRRRPGRVRVKPANASVRSARACSSAREPRCGQGLHGPQRPPPAPGTVLLRLPGEQVRAAVTRP